MTGARLNPRVAWVVGAALCIALVVVGLLSVGNVSGTNRPTGRAVHPDPLKSIAVLPFHDLTEEMTQTPFADGMTVELVDKLSKLPGLRVHAPMSSSSLEGNRFTIADMAKMLDVA